MSKTAINKIITTLDNSTVDFLETLSPIQEQTFKKVIGLIKELDVVNGNIKNSYKNIQLIGSIKDELDKIVLSKPYLKSVAEFVKTFDTVTALQNNYFASLNVEFSPSRVLEALKKASVATVIEQLTENGIRTPACNIS